MVRYPLIAYSILMILLSTPSVRARYDPAGRPVGTIEVANGE